MRFIAPFLICSIIYAANEIGLNIGLNSINNEDSLRFKNFRLGLNYQYNMLKTPIKPRIDFDYVNITDYYDKRVKSLYKGSLNGVYQFENNFTLKPYIFAGGGYEIVNKSLKDQFESAPFIQAGAGISYKVKNNFKVNFETKALQIINKKNQANEFAFGIGFSIPIGSEKNSDDNDGDGVKNGLDKCPNTPKGFKVDNNGCEKSINLNINFASGKYNLMPSQLQEVKKLAYYLKTHPNKKVIIQGFTDNIGSYSYNMKLSQLRAKSVAKTLIVMGIPSNRISYIGYGPNYPIASNETQYGRALNRRIIAKILN